MKLKEIREMYPEGTQIVLTEDVYKRQAYISELRSMRFCPLMKTV